MKRVRYQNQLPNLVANFLNNELEGMHRKNISKTHGTLPLVNIKENEDLFEVEVAAPGFNKTDFSVELNNDVLTISSEKKNEEKDNEKSLRQEFNFQSFKRSFTLPELVEDDKISAKYENGILAIAIPKKEEAKPKPVQLIEIK